ncbi:hypothetical protein ACOSQ4_003189 [Xanthoceras sorbifolium]
MGKVAITDIVAETTNHKQNLREPQSGAVSMFNDLTYMPQVNDDRKPNLLQEFMNLDDVHAFYNNYAKEAGFSVRLGSSKKSKDTNVIERKEYLCYKEGVSCILEKSDRKRRRSITRECCSAKLAVVRTKKGTYKVSQFIEGHTHPLATPRKVHLLRSHRKVSMAQKSLSQKLSAANIPTHQQISILEMEAGGIQNIGCTKTNIYNYERDLQNAMKGHDAELLYEYFESEQEKNSSFTFKIKAGDDDRIIHSFWADTVSRRAYKYFNDVIVFNTTNAPKMIITDQDPTITKAIAQAFPNTYHRFCIWHILNKFSEKLNAVIYRDHYVDFRNCIWESYTVDEFESKWLELIKNCKLHENGWFQSLYEIPESCHSFFKKYVFKKNSLMDFILRFNRALAHQCHEELIVDHTDSNGKPVLKSQWSMENQMAELYTQRSFYIFQDELWNTLNDDCCVYKVDKRNEVIDRTREIICEKPGGFASCSCKKFESEGISCRHFLSYFNLMQVAFLPTAKCDVVIDDKGTEISDIQDKSMLTCRTRLFQLASNVIENVVGSEEASKILEDDLNNVLSKVKSVSLHLKNWPQNFHHRCQILFNIFFYFFLFL